jgi:hypothetical protein
VTSNQPLGTTVSPCYLLQQHNSACTQPTTGRFLTPTAPDSRGPYISINPLSLYVRVSQPGVRNRVSESLADYIRVCLRSVLLSALLEICRGIESRSGQGFLHPSRQALGPIQSPVQGVPGLFHVGKAVGAWS